MMTTPRESASRKSGFCASEHRSAAARRNSRSLCLRLSSSPSAPQRQLSTSRPGQPRMASLFGQSWVRCNAHRRHAICHL